MMMELVQVVVLTLKRMLHDRGATLCLLLSMMSALLPVMLIFGLKNGYVESTRGRLLSNPEVLSISHKSSTSLSAELIEEINSWPEVAFAAPMGRTLGKLVHVRRNDAPPMSSSVFYDLYPTGPNDPVLKSRRAAVPGDYEICISAHLAEQEGLQVGDMAAVEVCRIRGEETLSRAFPLRVVSILPPSAGYRNGAFVSQRTMLRCIQYNEGFIGSGDGLLELPQATYTGLLIRGKVNESLIRELNRVFGGRIEAQEGTSAANLPEGCHYVPLRLSLSQEAVDGKLKSLGGERAAADVCAWNLPLDAALEHRPFRLCGRRSDAGAWTCRSQAPVLYSSDSSVVGERRHLSCGKTELLVDVAYDASVAAGCLELDSKLLGVIRTCSQRRSQWDYADDFFVFYDDCYSTMRLYAKRAEDLKPLLEKARRVLPGCSANVAQIDAVFTLDRNLTILTLIVAVITAVGGCLSLAINLFQAVRTRLIEFAMLKTLGMGNLSLSCCPLLESTFTLLLAFAGSYGVYSLAVVHINDCFAEFLLPGESICQLTSGYVIAMAAAALGVAVLSSAVSSVYVWLIPPAATLRAAP